MKNSNRIYALLSGISLIVMAIAAGYAYGYVQSTVFTIDDPQSTLNNLNSNVSLFGSGVAAWGLILLTDILVAWGLHRFFVSVNHSVSFTTGFIRLIYSVVLAVAIYQLLAIFQLLPTGEQNAIVIMNLFNGFETYWSYGLILFGFHLIGLGYLSLASGFVPKWIGWLLYIAGFSYILIHGAKALAPNMTEIIASAEMILSVPMTLAELSLAIWLIWRGGKTNEI